MLEIFVDGACRGNPGPAAIGVVIKKDNEVIKEISRDIGNATNNIAEYSALICALKEAKDLKAEDIEVYGDSQLVCRQVLGAYKVKHPNIIPLFEEVKGLIKDFKSFKLTHVLREKNKEADRLANMALDG